MVREGFSQVLSFYKPFTPCPTTTGSDRRLLGSRFSFSFGWCNFKYFASGEVVGVDTRIVNAVKANDHGVFNAALVDGGNGAHFLKPVGFFAEDANLRTTLNHELFFLCDE